MIISLPLPAGAENDVTRIGGKARGLQDLMRLGAPVPPAFVVPPDVDIAAPAFRAALEEALAVLGDVPLAVRSSGMVEDGKSASFAGIYETILDVRGADAALDALHRCRASAGADRVRAYGARQGLEEGAGARIAVVVQRLVRAEAAGVAFSADPVARRRDRSVIEAVPGLGEALVSGHGNPDRARVDRSGVVVERTSVSGCLPDALAQEVAARAVDLEESLGYPVDVEWAVEAGRLWLLQVRPITTSLDDRAPPAPPPAQMAAGTSTRILWTNTNAAEILPDVAKPLVFAAAQRYVRALLLPVVAPFGLDPLEIRALGLVGGRVYFNLNAVLGWVRSFPGLGSFDATRFAHFLGGNADEIFKKLGHLRREDIPQHKLPLHRAVWGAVRVGAAVVSHHRGDGSVLVDELRRLNDRDEATDLSAMNDAALLARLDAITHAPFGPVENADAIASALVGMICQALLPQLTRRWLGDDSGALAGRLLQGMGGLASAEAGLALWRLGALARSCGIVAALEGSFEETRARLDPSPEGRRFLHAFSAFLRTHGHHARGECDVSVPRWAEQPAYVLRLVRAAASGETSTASDEEDRTSARAALLAELSTRVGPLKRRVFLGVVSRAARGAASRENGKSEAMRRMFLARLTILEVGRRAVAARAIDDIDDVFFLLFDELRPALGGADMGESVRARRRQHARHLAIEPPPVVVSDENGAYDPPQLRLPTTTTDKNVLRGIAASPGIVEGPARVVLRADDDTVVKPGEILIAPFTDPGWTPYFLSAAGVVMDFGGMLSHGSVVAREYGLPAVVNVGPATKQIRDGQRVRVDGDRGVVELLADD